MNSIKVLCLLAFVGVSLAVNCGSGTEKQQTTFNPDNSFYTLNFWANAGATTETQEERDAIWTSGRSVWMKSSACFKVKAQSASNLIKVCAETKFADAIVFKYKDSTGWHTGATKTISDNSVFKKNCFNQGSAVIADVEKISICFSASQNVKLQEVYVGMCAAA